MNEAKPTALRILIDIVIGLALTGLTLASLGRLCWAGFQNGLDDQAVTDNPFVKVGLIDQAVNWALKTFHTHNWHPLTWLSLQADASLFGKQAWGFHLTNLLLHTASVVVLFVVLRWMTADRWRSAAVAAFFAVHPLHVEAVAWVAQRKEVLGGLWWMLTLAAYAAYARRPGPVGYALVVLALALGLTASPMLVTLPFVLLLLDYWPLGRLRHGGTPLWWLVVEKLPLLALAAGCCAATLAAQDNVLPPWSVFSLKARILNALVSCVTYLGQTLWPTDLAVFYPHPGEDMAVGKVAGAVAVLLGITAAAVWQARQRPYLIVGWLWYLGTLVPVLGLVPLGPAGHADRYTYIPLIGIFLMAAWGVPDLLASWHLRPAAAVAAGALVVACAALAWVQAGLWQDSRALWQHTLGATAKNFLAHEQLGKDLLRRGELTGAREQFEAALAIEPRLAASYAGLGEVHRGQGDPDAAARSFEEAQRLDPRLAPTELDLAAVAARRGRLPDAVRHYLTALELRPDQPEVHTALAGIYTRQGKLEKAQHHYRQALQIRPSMIGPRMSLAALAARLGRPDEAIREFEEVQQQLKPQLADDATGRAQGRYTEAIYQIAVMRCRQGQPREALASLQQVVEAEPHNPRYRFGWAHALYATGDKAAAAKQYQEGARRDTRWPDQANQLAWAMATYPDDGKRDSPMAVDLARQACEATEYQLPEYLDTLAAALAESGRFPEAVATARMALQRTATDRADLMAGIRERLRTFEQGQPWHQPVPE
jgi:tetratricopeptide (TPR) repeat protein